MLELQCTCGWRCEGESKQELLQQVLSHLPECPDRPRDEPIPPEGMVRALIEQRARPIAQ